MTSPVDGGQGESGAATPSRDRGSTAPPGAAGFSTGERAQPALPRRPRGDRSIDRAWQGRRTDSGARAGCRRLAPQGGRWAGGAAAAEGMTERRWRVSTGTGRPGLFLIEVDDGRGFRPATVVEVDSALRQRELFGAADYPAPDLAHDDGPDGGPPNQPAPPPAGLDGREDE